MKISTGLIINFHRHCLLSSMINSAVVGSWYTSTVQKVVKSQHWLASAKSFKYAT